MKNHQSKWDKLADRGCFDHSSPMRPQAAIFGMAFGIMLHMTIYGNGDSFLGGSYQERQSARIEAASSPRLYPGLRPIDLPGAWIALKDIRKRYPEKIDVAELGLNPDDPQSQDKVKAAIESAVVEMLVRRRHGIDGKYAIACEVTKDADQNTYVPALPENRKWCSYLNISKIKYRGISYRFEGNVMIYWVN